MKINQSEEHAYIHIAIPTIHYRFLCGKKKSCSMKRIRFDTKKERKRKNERSSTSEPKKRTKKNKKKRN